MEWLLLGVAVLLVAANAVFVAAEFSLVTVDRTQVGQEAARGDRRAGRVLEALRTLSTQLSGAQLGITVTSLVVGFLAEPSLATLLAGPLEALGIPGAAVVGIATFLALLLATGFQMIFGELVPKNLAIARPAGVARAVAGAQRGFATAAGPLIRFLNGNANWLLGRMGIKPQEELASARNPEELVSLVRRSAQVGTLPARTATLLDRSLRFGDRDAVDVLTPRVRVRFVAARTPLDEVVELARTTGHSRFPVEGDGPDEVTGVVQLRAALGVDRDRRASVTAGEIADRPLLVPESVPLDELLTRLRAGGGQLAVVLDEYGGTAGVVTLEDLVEELVGEVADEHDRPVARVTRTREGGYVISGLLRPDEVRELGIPVPDSERYDTFAGFVTDQLGRLAEVGDAVDTDGWRLTVGRLDGRRVDRVTARSAGQRSADDGEAGR